MEKFGELDDLDIQNLYETAWRSLHYRRLDEAQDVAEKILQIAPDSTSAHELWGDVLLALGDKEAAAAEFKHALELEPANVDAERKYGMVVLQLQEAAGQRQALESGDLSRFRGVATKEPSVAAGRSAVFPGMGQLYNGEYEKGVVLAVLGLLLVIPAVNKFFEWVMPSGPPSLGGSILGWLGLIGYALTWAYSVYDAYQSGQRIAAQQEEIGTRMSSQEVDK